MRPMRTEGGNEVPDHMGETLWVIRCPEQYLIRQALLGHLSDYFTYYSIGASCEVYRRFTIEINKGRAVSASCLHMLVPWLIFVNSILFMQHFK